MAFAGARYVYDCIMALPAHLADQFRALEYENEVEEGIASASRVAGHEPDDWKKVTRSRRANYVDWNAVQSSHDDLARRLTSASSASGLLQHRELFDSLLELTFESPNDMGLDVQWDGYPLRWKLGDLHARQGTREPVTYPVAPADDSASCYWAVAKRMVSEVDYVALFTWIKSIDNLWTNEFQTVYIYVALRIESV